ncbi:hypothetical protein NA78x_001574 [Anatilimnocola sp. NA78]|uniref:hypothetical protein n=1 Tax=Anatilimnocola sp. NA78 TaxID=3415683 RepID=UPI003CE4681A
MEDCGDIVVSCENQDRVIGAVNRILPRLPKDLRGKLNGIKLSMLQHVGKEGIFVCFNGKSVSAIIAEYEQVFQPEQSTAGEIDGMRFQLYEAPKKKITIDEFGRPKA